MTGGLSRTYPASHPTSAGIGPSHPAILKEKRVKLMDGREERRAREKEKDGFPGI